MAKNTIEFQLCAEDRQRLDTIIDRLSALLRKPEPAPAVEAAAVKQEAPAVPEAAPAPEHTRDELRDVVRRMIRPDCALRELAKDVVLEYADRVSKVPEESIGELIDRLLKLERGEDE